MGEHYGITKFSKLTELDGRFRTEEKTEGCWEKIDL